MDKINNVSSDSVKKATGKGWGEWIKKLDGLGASKMSHKDISECFTRKAL